MNETCSKCGAPLDTDGYCSYHQSRTYQEDIFARQENSVGQSDIAEIDDQDSIGTLDLLGIVLSFAYLVAILYDALGGSFDLFPVTFPMLIFAQMVKLFTGLGLVWICWKRKKPIWTALWVGNILFTLIHLSVLLWE